MTLPNFIIIGAAKAGTTALYHYLCQHPQVFMAAIKEPRFFALEGQIAGHAGPGDALAERSAVTTRQAYEALFHGVKPQHKAVGESSAKYLHSETAPQRIGQMIPDVRLIAILRQPADRAFSNYVHLVRAGREPLADFEAALADEPRRLADNWSRFWGYRLNGFYHDSLQRWFDQFGRERIRVHLHDDLHADAAAVMRDVFAFLDVQTSFEPDTSFRPNAGGVPRSGAAGAAMRLRNRLRPYLRWIKPLVPTAVRSAATRMETRNLIRVSLDPDLRQRLTQDYRDDILRTADLIGRDLSHWLE